MLLKKAKSNKKDLEFYSLCKNNSNEEKIRKFLIREYYNGFSIKKFLSSKDSQFDNYGLTAGLLVAIENNHNKYIDIILDHIADHRLDNQNYNASMQLVFNCAAKFKKMDVLKRLDNQFCIIDNVLNEEVSLEMNYKLNETMYAGVTNDGNINLVSYRLFDDEIKDKLESYNQNPVIYNLINANMEVIDFMFEKEIEPNQTLIENGFLTALIRRMTERESEPSKIVLNDKCREIIKKSSIINVFLNEPKTRPDVKKEIFAVLEMIELKEELPNNNLKPNKLKL